MNTRSDKFPPTPKHTVSEITAVAGMIILIACGYPWYTRRGGVQIDILIGLIILALGTLRIFILLCRKDGGLILKWILLAIATSLTPLALLFSTMVPLASDVFAIFAGLWLLFFIFALVATIRVLRAQRKKNR